MNGDHCCNCHRRLAGPLDRFGLYPMCWHCWMEKGKAKEERLTHRADTRELMNALYPRPKNWQSFANMGGVK